MLRVNLRVLVSRVSPPLTLKGHRTNNFHDKLGPGCIKHCKIKWDFLQPFSMFRRTLPRAIMNKDGLKGTGKIMTKPKHWGQLQKLPLATSPFVRCVKYFPCENFTKNVWAHKLFCHPGILQFSESSYLLQCYTLRAKNINDYIHNIFTIVKYL